ncbi:MAG: uncharacterized protein A8A55_1482 [Amphiamblys sp. WSBS2006]|nr:MAG: uncharacterized protein A8A55_1482 [Amphiamblys sp. WSBS2006]
MFDLARKSFAKHGDSFFLEEKRGVLIISKGILEKRHDDIQKKRQFLFSQRQEVLSGLVAQLQAPESFLLTQSLPNEAILLTEKTTVTLSNIEISVKLFFVLLEKTKVDVNENFSITEHIGNEDCIRESGMGRNNPVCLRRNEVVSRLAMKNIERMPSNSIGCVLREIGLEKTGLINILPKLRNKKDRVDVIKLFASEEEHVAGILARDQPFCVWRVRDMFLEGYAVGVVTKLSREDSEIKCLDLSASEKEHVSAILAKDNPFSVVRVNSMFFEDYAVGFITKLSREGCEIERFDLSASKKEHVAAVLGHNRNFCVGRVKWMRIDDYAVGVVTKIRVHEDYEIERFDLSASRKEHITEILEQEKPFCVGRVKRMWLLGYAVGVITKMDHEDCEVERLWLVASEKEHVAGILKQSQTICVGRVKILDLDDYAVSILPKLGVHKNCVVELLRLYADEKEHVAAVLEHNRKFCVGRVKNMWLEGYAVSILLKMRVHEDNTIEEFVLDADKEQLSRILEEGDNSIELGRIRQFGFDIVPEEIRRKLRYTIVDGEGREVLEERDNQRGNILE